ncbi:MAG: hypothetical protein IJU50_06870 [Lachnospiraceae bacterium]|nr:hypothetical protein [Lachnospiraceae bacterium]
MGQILKYIQVQGNAAGTLAEKDFDILKRFVRIGMEAEVEKSSSVKLEKQLFGMENVKQQVREIVEVIDEAYSLTAQESGETGDSFSQEAVAEIVHIQAKNQSFILNRRADPEILAYFKERVSDWNFGNGREARSLIENAMVFAAERVKKIPVGKIKKRQLQEITVSDIRKALERLRRSNLMQMGRSAAEGYPSWYCL